MTDADMLAELDAYLARYVAFPRIEARWAVALWTVHCHAVDAFESTPRLALLSPEKGSGKTRTLEVLGLVVPEPIHAVNMSPSALFRIVADGHPTLLLDEADTYLGISSAKTHEDLRGLINAGHRRGAQAYRAEVTGRTVKAVSFPAFAPCALAGIGDLPDTILDRSVVIAMKRRAPHERIEPFRERVAGPAAANLAGQLAKWGIAHMGPLTDAWPDMPMGITDRAADVWEPLVAIGDLIGDPWPDRARNASVILNDARLNRDPSLGIQLLTDCRTIIGVTSDDRVTSEDLVAALVAIDERPWADLRGKPIDARGVARRLRRYDIKPGDHRFGQRIAKGYRAEDFHDAWTRYLPPTSTVADVAHVAHPWPTRETNGDVAHTEDEVGRGIPLFSEEVSLSSSGEGQQGQQGQQSRHARRRTRRHPAGRAMTIEQRVRAMTKAERRAYLLAHGWTRLSSTGSGCWFHPTRDLPGGDRGFYTLAAAIRTGLAQENW